MIGRDYFVFSPSEGAPGLWGTRVTETTYIEGIKQEELRSTEGGMSGVFEVHVDFPRIKVLLREGFFDGTRAFSFALKHAEARRAVKVLVSECPHILGLLEDRMRALGGEQ